MTVKKNKDIVCKGQSFQLISKCLFGVIVWTKIATKILKNFFPESFYSFLGDSLKLFGVPVGFLFNDIT